MGALSVRVAAVAIASLLLVTGARDAHAQLISPGKLTRPHSELEGIRNCTRCHELGKPGASDGKCLACHEPLAARMRAGTGYHATLEGKVCAECHKEHFGEEFELVRFDSAGFDHAAIGYPLDGGHDAIGCRDCHQPQLIAATDVRGFKGEASALGRTYLGLGKLCLSCHEADDPHRGQFAKQSCDECHGEDDWKEARRFDHDRTRYRLTGLHRRVRCRDCHRPLDGPVSAGRLQFTGLAFGGCESCHRDVHRGAMGPRCERCHGTAGWHRIADRGEVERGFDHSTTDFTLVGAHARAECSACHSASSRRDDRLRMTFVAGTERNVYPHPVATACTSCHLDYHSGAFAGSPGGIACEGCHGEDDWTPTTYGIDRHNRESKFELTGAHIPVICTACHAEESAGYHVLRFRIADQTCVGCHSTDDPHAGQFGARVCTECHDTNAFKVASFDHSRTRWPLDGAHRDVPCASCHAQEQTTSGALVVRYRPLATECRTCHREDA